MTTVTLATHCHSRDLPRLHAPGVLEELIDCHQYDFSEVIVIHQRCGDLSYSTPPNEQYNGIRVINVNSNDYEWVLSQFGIPHLDPALSEITHGWDWQWYYEHHCVNHCAETLAAYSDYIVFNDADCRIKSQPYSWIQKGIELLETYSNIFMVSPSDGGFDFTSKLSDGTRLTQMTSQQLFMARTQDMKNLNFTNLQWDGKFIEGGPMQEWYGMFEGWLYRHMRANGLYRAILPEAWRYWHSEWH